MTDDLPPLPHPNPYQFAPMSDPPSVWNVVSALLKQPGRVIYELLHGKSLAVLTAMVAVAAVSLGIYGAVVGSLVGEQQYWIAPVKILAGSAFAALICLPSLYVFLCMNGAEAHLRHVGGLLAASVCLMAVLLVSLSPIAWIFSQSTDSVPLMGALHLLLWAVGLGFGLRLLSKAAVIVWGTASNQLGTWTLIYVLVCLQMMTAIRPIVGRSDDFLPQKKEFFLVHWWEVFTA